MNDWLEMSRREFLAALGATYGSTACAWAAPRSHFIDYATGDGKPPIERFVNTSCPMCPGGCGLNVRVVHGCAVGVRGNKSHPINRGGLCSRASAILQDVYNPDRLRAPLRRIGERGSDRWEEIGWDGAIEMISERLRTIRGDGRPERLCVMLGRDRGATRTAWGRFARAYGTPNLIDTFPADNRGVLPAVLATHGVRQRIGYDIAGASFVLSISSAWLDAHWSSEQAARAFADFRRGRPGFRPKWVHAEPRFSLTAVKADEWLPIYPGTEGTLALGIAHIIIREGLYDSAFIQRHGHGFDDWTDERGKEHLGFRRMVLEDYSPPKVEAVTGVPEGTLFRVAREFALNRPAVALGFDGGGCGVQATYDRMAIHSLNALVGSIDVPGGVSVDHDLSLLEQDQDIDETARRGLAAQPLDGSGSGSRLSDTTADLLAESIANRQPYPAEALFLIDSDPVFELAEGSRFAEAMKGVPFIAAFAGYHGDSSRYADLIIPSLHGLHRWDFNTAHTLKGHPVVTISHPVLPPPPGMRDTFEVVRAVAGQLGGKIERALPWSSSKEVIDEVCRELFDKGKGAAFGPANEESWAQMLESRGWRAPFAENYEDFKRDVLSGGGWIDPIYFHQEWDRVFQSPSRKFAFSSQFLARSFEAAPQPVDSFQADRRCLPQGRRKKRGHDAKYPLDLYVYPLPNLVAVASPNLPWLNEIAGAYSAEKWRTWIEIHPETAHRLGIGSGDPVLVETRRGKLVLPAKLYTGLMPEVIAIPFGFGHKAGGRWCRDIGENPAALIEASTDPLTGGSLWNSTRASIKPAGVRRGANPRQEHA